MMQQMDNAAQQNQMGPSVTDLPVQPLILNGNRADTALQPNQSNLTMPNGKLGENRANTSMPNQMTQSNPTMGSQPTAQQTAHFMDTMEKQLY